MNLISGSTRGTTKGALDNNTGNDCDQLTISQLCHWWGFPDYDHDDLDGHDS